jgi:hypothetical protein
MRTVTSPNTLWPCIRTMRSGTLWGGAETSLRRSLLKSHRTARRGCRCDQHIDVAKDRIRVDDDVRGCAVGLGEVDHQVPKDRNRNELVFHIPVLRACALSTGFEDGIHRDETPSSCCS